ncbi:MAG: TolC family protein, partial [Gammaproteobacteria bacterium]
MHLTGPIAGLGLLLLGSAVTAATQPGLQHASEPVPTANLSLGDVVEAAWRRMPERPLVPAMRAESEALSRRSDSLLSGPPSLTAFYRSDQPRTDTGVREMDLGLTLPLWNWGQQDAATAWSAAADADAALSAAAWRLEAAGQVRDSLWQLVMAGKRVELARLDESEAEHLVDLVERRHASGDVARADLLLARNVLMDRQAVRLEAEARLMDARRVYAELTGLSRRPAEFSEQPTAVEHIPLEHPFLARARARVARAASELAWERESKVANPSVMIGTRRERADYSADSIDSVYLQFNVPFGQGSANAEKVAAAGRRLAEAETARNNLMRSLRLALHEAEHRLDVDRRALALHREQLDVANQRARMNERAYALGETDVFQLVQARTQAQRARLNAEEMALQVQWDIARL